MVIKEIFDEFIRVVEENHKYTIGLVDKQKNIVFCSRQDLVGHIMDYEKPDSENVFFKIEVQNQSFGYLWVSGNDNLEMISKLLHESLVVRLMYEINQSKLNRKVTKDDELVKLLLNKDGFDRDQVLNLMNELEFDMTKAVVAIYVIHNEGFNNKDVMRLKMRSDNKESIYSLLDDQSLLIFKTLPQKCSDENELKNYIDEYISSLRNWDINNCYYLIGTAQYNIRRYMFSFKSALWVKNNIHLTKEKPLFFIDYIDSFLLQKIPQNDIEDIFNFYIESNKNIDKEEFVEIAEKLYQNDFNLTQAANSLFLHKNTLIYKLRKYEEIFQIDIRGIFSGKILFILISNIFKDEAKEIQAGEIR